MLSAKSSGLVAGSTAQPTMDKVIKIKVERPFYFERKVLAKGSIVDLPAAIASEVIGMGKAVKYTAPPPKAEKVEAKAADVKEAK